ncbi:MAG: T9SS type A sorting domain-containing protein [Bacteroidia bacterium]|nr:T9SS type A sorting domain-containing protein [Bacteroidia bacterium]
MNTFFNKTRFLLVGFLWFVSNVNGQQYQWAKKIGSIGHDVANCVVTDLQGNTYTVGSFEGTIDFDPTPNFELLNPMGNTDAYIVKYNAAGIYQWSKSISGLNNEIATAVSINKSGVMAIVGYFNGTVDFNPDTTQTHWLTAKGSQDIFTVVLDSAGNFLWAAAQGGNGIDVALAVFIDDSNTVYNAGYFEKTADFNPDTNATFNLTALADFDGFATKLVNGVLIWAMPLTNNKDLEIRNIEVVADKMYLSGITENTTDFNPGTGSYSFTAAGGTDAFIACYDTATNIQWAHLYGGTLGDIANKMTVNGNYVYLTGYFRGTVAFNPDTINNPPVVSAGLTDIFILKTDIAGNFIWVATMGDTQWDESYGIAIDHMGRVITTGSFRGNTDFNPGTGINILSSPQSAAIYVLVLDSAANYVWALQAGGTDQERGLSVAIDANNQINVAGYFNGLVYFDLPSNGLLYAQGYQDAFLAKYSFCLPTTTNVTAVACNSYTLPGGNIVYTTSGSYTETITNSQGCDSIILLQLTINNDTMAVDSIISCQPITWIDGNLYSSSNNTATFVYPGGAANGCDSIVYLDLTINTINNQIFFQNDTLFANDTLANIQWFTCDSIWQPIANATGSYWVPVTSGNYAAVFNNGNCTDSSQCINVQVSGISSTNSNLFSIYPNPTNNRTVTFSLKQAQPMATLQVFNNQGLLCSQVDVSNKLTVEVTLPQVAGLYAICLSTPAEKTCRYVVKQ